MLFNVDKHKKIIAYLFIILVCVIVPFSFDNGYFNITKAKADTYRIGILILLLFIVFISYFDKNKIKYKPSKLEMFLIVFGILSIISTFLSYDFGASFYGNHGWFIGSFTIITGIFFSIYISKSKIDLDNVFKIIAIANIFILSITILHSMKIDIFSLHDNILNKQYFSYVSTIGNVNWMVGYLCLISPLMLHQYLNSNDKYKTLYLIVMFLIVFNIILINSDAIYLGIGFISFVLIPYMFIDKDRLNKLCTLLLMFVLTCLLVKMPVFSSKFMTISGITKIMISPSVVFLILVVALIFKIILKCNIYNKKMAVFIIVLFEVCITLVVIYFIYDMVSAFKTYNTYWGNNRALIWQKSLFMYKYYFNIRQQIFGVGPEFLYEWYYYLSLELNAKVLVSHSEPMQILLTMGIVGLSSYVLIVVTIIKSLFHKNIFNTQYFPFIISLLAYFAQSFVNSMSPVNAGILFMILGVYIKTSKIPTKVIEVK